MVRERQKSPAFKVSVTETEAENKCEKISVYAEYQTQDLSFCRRALYPYATTTDKRFGVITSVLWAACSSCSTVVEHMPLKQNLVRSFVQCLPVAGLFSSLSISISQCRVLNQVTK